MKISTTTSAFTDWGDSKEILSLLKDCGFTAYDCSLEKAEILTRAEYADEAKKLRVYADELGLPCNQTHAPFPLIRKGDEAYNAERFTLAVRAVEVSGILGAKVCVVHASNDYTMQENLDFYNRLVPYAKKANVKIGVENLYNWWKWGKPEGHILPGGVCSHHDEFFAYMERLDKDVFTACVDIGHAELMQEFGTDAAKMIERLGSYMGAMHLHDVDYLHDNHAYPYSCKVDFEKVIEALKKIGYQGDITMEASLPVKNVPRPLIPAATKYLAEIGKYFKSRLEE